MSAASPTAWKHSNQYNAESACGHCNGVIRHEPWCKTVNEAVLYGYEIIVDPASLTFEDGCILHALGVTWSQSAS
jgi:hypothetical protein